MKNTVSNWKRIVSVGAILASVGLTVVNAADKSTQVKAYPLTTCLVSGEKLGGMGDAYVFTNKTQEIKLCCKGCLKAFEKDPAKHLKKLDAEAKTTAPAKPAPYDGHHH